LRGARCCVGILIIIISVACEVEPVRASAQAAAAGM
jgi:hypothetical protein